MAIEWHVFYSHYIQNVSKTLAYILWKWSWTCHRQRQTKDFTAQNDGVVLDSSDIYLYLIVCTPSWCAVIELAHLSQLGCITEFCWRVMPYLAEIWRLANCRQCECWTHSDWLSGASRCLLSLASFLLSRAKLPLKHSGYAARQTRSDVETLTLCGSC